jgi:hypothetical protein
MSKEDFSAKVEGKVVLLFEELGELVFQHDNFTWGRVGFLTRGL